MDDRSASTSATQTPTPEASGISGLKKMSTTAGLGTGDYAAVNTLSVVALMGAAVGGLALLTELLLVLPVAVIVTGFVSLRQIHASNGTQTGRAPAILAIVISLGIIGYVVGSRIVRHVQTKPDQEQLLALIDQFDKAMAARDYAGAYQLTSPQFRSRVSEDRWVQTFQMFEGIADNGGVNGIEWNKTPIEYQDDPETTLKKAWVGTLFKYRKEAPPNRIPVGFQRQNGKWSIHEIPALFK